MLTCTWKPWLFAALLLGDVVLASSQAARPLKRIEHPSTLAIEILPRKSSLHAKHAVPHGKRILPLDSPVLRHSDTFRLELSAFDEVFYLHLRPNEHLVHPAARINHFQTTADGKSVLAQSEPLLRDSVRAYWGEVIPPESSPDRLREDAAGVLARPWRDPSLGWARITMHDQGNAVQGIAPVFEGAFSVRGVVYHVMTKDNYLRNRHALDPPVTLSDADPDSALVIWRDSDMVPAYESGEEAGACAHDALDYNVNPELNPVLRLSLPEPDSAWYDPLGLLDTFASNASLARRSDLQGGSVSSNFSAYIGSSAGCPTSEKIIYMGVATDCEYTSYYGSAANATRQVLTDWNLASALYKSTFNVTLGIIELQVQDATCPNTTDPTVPWNLACSTETSLNDRLSLFSQWRGQKGDDGAGLWHLMSGCPTGTEVGVAWLATLCQQDAVGSGDSVVSGTAVTTAGRTEWQVASHEIGHNFGAIHDCTSGCGQANSTLCCPLSASECNANSQFVMNPVTESQQMQFSPCSLGNICTLMQSAVGMDTSTNTTCLVSPNSPESQQLLTLNMCGNGIVEPGEQCDPGRGSNSTCCDTTTCQFTAGAVCDPGSSPCCTDSCNFAPSTQVCRPAIDTTCDTTEFCTGSSSACPADVTAPNGLSCGAGGLTCASGHCTSLNLQCQAAGSSLNLTTACSNVQSSSCMVSCVDPTQASECISLATNLLDGSPCGYAGTCSSGNCVAGSALATFSAWYKENLSISIPSTIGIALLAAALSYLIYRCCTAKRRRQEKARRKSAKQAAEKAAHAKPLKLLALSTDAGRWMPQTPLPAVQSDRSKWVDTTAYNG